MSIGRIGQNGLQEYLEECVYGYGYQETRERTQAMTREIDDEVQQDAVQSMLNVFVQGIMSRVVQAIEDALEAIFNLAKALIAALVGSQMFKGYMNRFKNLRGVKLFKKLSFMGNAFADRIQLAHLVNNMTTNHMKTEDTVLKQTSMVTSSASVKEHILNKERFKMEFAKTLADRYTQTFIPKLLTKSFTSTDIPTIKQVFGRDTASEMDVEALNRVADFLFVTDDAGNVHGFSDIAMSLINGLGYFHNK